jgi:hypothetical protein
MAGKNAAAQTPPETPNDVPPEAQEPLAAEETPVPVVVAGPPLAEPVREHIWDEEELLRGALREHWQPEDTEEVTDNA